jgi:hypothetical protein
MNNFSHPLAMIALKITTDRNVIDFTPHLRRKRLENSRLVRKSIDQILQEVQEEWRRFVKTTGDE